MPLVPFKELMSAADNGNYAVGYFECWNLESLQGVIDAAIAEKSPVIVGFSGLFLPDPARLRAEDLTWYSALGARACETASVPCGFLYNESPYLETVLQAAQLDFNIIMYSDDDADVETLTQVTQQVVAAAHPRGIAVQAELGTLPFGHRDADAPRTDPDTAAKFVADTQVDALAVSVGNVHVLVDGTRAELDLDRVKQLHDKVPVPLVLHGGTGIADASLQQAIAAGIRMVHLGATLKQTFLRAVDETIKATATVSNPHKRLGSGTEDDVLMAGRLAVCATVRKKIQLYGSAGKATI